MTPCRFTALPQRGDYPHFSSLVSLRFFAAASVVFAHSYGLLTTTYDYEIAWGFPSVMVFFHILSGFTLTYVYTALETRTKILRFWIARVGRVWPVHVGVIALIILFSWRAQAFDADWWRKLALSLTLTQSWIPYKDASIAFNGPAWSLSTEFGMYLLFPLLIRNWSCTWHFKLLAVFCIAIALACYSNYLNYHAANHVPGSKITIADLVYIHPLTRLPEFVLGMTLALFWKRTEGQYGVGIVTGTIIETGALALCVFTMMNTHFMAKSLNNIYHLGDIWTIWLERILFPLGPFALLIFVFSMNRGMVSSLLSHPPFVFLGDLSFSIYLIHFPLRDAFRNGMHDHGLPAQIAVPVYWCCTLLLSYIVYRIWEQPCRRFFKRLLPVSAGES